MKHLILALALLLAVPAQAQDIPARFDVHTDLRPFVTWIAQHTRFRDADRITSDEVPEIVFLNGSDYMRLVRVWGLAAYSPEINTIAVNMDLDGNRADVLIHELIHFYQWRQESWDRGDNDSREREAQQIQRQFLTRQ